LAAASVKVSGVGMVSVFISLHPLQTHERK
jgi:hypothetical protein